MVIEKLSPVLVFCAETIEPQSDNQSHDAKGFKPRTFCGPVGTCGGSSH